MGLEEEHIPSPTPFSHLPPQAAAPAQDSFVAGCRIELREWERLGKLL